MKMFNNFFFLCSAVLNNMARSIAAKLLCCFILLFLCGNTLFAQPDCPSGDPNVQDPTRPWLEHRIINLKYDPNPALNPYANGFGVIQFEYQIRAGENYLTQSVFEFGNSNVMIPMYDFGVSIDPYSMIGAAATSVPFEAYNTYGIAGCYTTVNFGWLDWGVMISVTKVGGAKFTDQFITIAIITLPIGHPSAPLVLGHPSPLGYIQIDKSNLSNQHSSWSPFENPACRFGFKDPCPERIYLETDPYATTDFNDTYGMSTEFCLDLSGAPFPPVINTNEDDVYYNTIIPGVWINAATGDTVPEIARNTKGTTTYIFRPGPHYDGYCYLDVKWEVTIIDPDNFDHDGEVTACEGEPLDLTKALTGATSLSDYKFYYCPTGDCEDVYIPIGNPANYPSTGLGTGIITDKFYVQYDGSECQGNFLPIEVKIEMMPAPIEYDMECTDGIVTRIEILNDLDNHIYSTDGITYFSDGHEFNNLMDFDQPSYTIYKKIHNGNCVIITTIACHTCKPVSIGTIQAVTYPTTCGTATGKIFFEVNGGEGTIKYNLYKNGVVIDSDVPYTDGVIDLLSAGVYYVEVWDDDYPECGTATSHQVILHEPTTSDLLVTVTVVDATNCTDSDGTLYIETVGGNGSYSYTLNGVPVTITDNKIPTLPVGEYVVTVTSDGCTANSGIVHIYSKSNLLDLGIGGPGNVSHYENCSNTSNGYFDMVFYSFTPNTYYQLNYLPPVLLTNLSETIRFTGLPAGEHVFRLFNDCGEISHRILLEDFYVPLDLKVEVKPQNTIQQCNGDIIPGSLTLEAIAAGSGQLEYQINDGGWTNFTSPETLPLPEGTYYIRVRDADGCYYEINDITIERKIAPPVTIGTLETREHPTACTDTDGEIFLEVINGSGAYKYNLYKNGELELPGGDTYPSNGKITGLGAGTYYIKVWDDGYECNFAITNSIILVAKESALSIKVTATDADDCISSTGTLFVDVTGGDGDYTYDIFPTGTLIGNKAYLAAGEYFVTVTDKTGCSVSSDKIRINSKDNTDTFTITGLDTVHIFRYFGCNVKTDGLIRVAIEGKAPYFYQLNYSTPIEALTDNVIAVFSGLPAGEHAIRVFSDCGEEFFKFNIMFDYVGEFTSMEAIPVNVLEYCDGTSEQGSLTLVVHNYLGSAQVEYKINDDDWEVLPLDANENPSSYSIPKPEGTYNVRVRVVDCDYYEVNNVIIGREKDIPVTLGTLEVGNHPTTCTANDGTIFYEIIPGKNGFGTYQYQVYKDGEPYEGVVNQQDGVYKIENLGAGTYYIELWDAVHDCNLATSNSVTLVVEDSDLSIKVTAKDASDCNTEDGALFIEVSGGYGLLTYSVFPTGIVNDYKVTGLKPGEYIVTVEDVDGCVASGSARINSKDDADTFTIVGLDTLHNTVCDENNGLIRVSITGKAPYKYQLNYEPAIEANTDNVIAVFSGLASGKHVIRAFSDCGEEFFEFTIENANSVGLSLNVIKQNVIEYCDNTYDPGYLILSVSPYVSAYEYQINDEGWKAFDGATILKMEGTYLIRVRDVATDCYFEVNDITISRETAPLVTLGTLEVANHPTTCIADNGTIYYEIIGSGPGKNIFGTYQYQVYKDGVAYGGIVNQQDGAYKIENLGAGTYYIELWDAARDCNLATSNSVTLVVEDSDLSIKVTAKDADNCGTTGNGALYIEVTGGTPSNYLLNGVSTTVTGNKIENLPAGEYIVTVEDAAGCVASSGVVRINSKDITDTFTIVGLDTLHNTVCGENNGLIRVSITGKAPYKYQLNYEPAIETLTEDNVIAVFSGLASGKHVIHAFSDCGEEFFEFTIENDNGSGAGLSFTVAPKNVMEYCDGAVVPGELALTINGTSTYEYQINYEGWKTFDGNPIEKMEGTYLIRVRDLETDCYFEVNDVTIVREKDTPVAVGTLQAQTHPGACGSTTGVIFFEVTGGSGVYEYNLYKNGTLLAPANRSYPTNGEITGLGAGTYYVEVWDADYACNFATSNSVTLIEAAGDLTIKVTAKDATDCNTDDGVLYVEVSGGTGNYTFTPTVTDNKIEGLYPGEYVVTVTDEAVPPCSASSGVVRINSGDPADRFIIVGLDTVHTVCGKADGLISVSITGNLPYSYQLNYGTEIAATSATEIATFSGLPAGEHVIRVFSDCGEDFFEFNIDNDDDNGLSFSVTAKNVMDYCDGTFDIGEIAITIFGGVPPYTYSIDGSTPASISNPSVLQKMEGTYYIRIYDDAGCSYEVNDITIGRETAPSVTLGTLQVLSHPGACGSTTGVIFFEANGGSGAYEYNLYKNGTLLAPANRPYPTNGEITGLGAGAYYVEVWDADYACNFATSNSVTLIEAAGDLTIKVTAKDATDCNTDDGVLYVEVTGGTGNYIFTPTVTDNKIEGLYPGEYVVTVTDEAVPPCSASSGIVRINSGDPADRFTIVGLDTVHTVCGKADGLIRVSITGNLPYSYQLNYGTEIAATSATEIAIFSGLVAGEHVIRVFSDCGEDFFKFNIDNDDDNGLSFTAVAKNVKDYCDLPSDLGEIALTINGSGTFTFTINGGTPLPISSVGVIPDLDEGTYYIRVYDDAGCSYEVNDITIGREKDTPVNIGTFKIEGYPAICGSANGVIFFEVFGGTGVYKYNLYKDGKLYRTDQSYPTNGKIENLGAGTYYVEVWDDAHDCNFAIGNSVVVSEAAGNVTIKVIAKDASDCTDDDGALYIEVTGGTGTPSFTLNGDPVTVTDNKIEGLTAGEYVVAVTSGGCTASSGVVRINSNDPADNKFTIVGLDTVHTVCGEANGLIRVSIEGNAPYKYQLNYGAVIETLTDNVIAVFSGLPAGEHVIRAFSDCGEEFFRFNIKNEDVNGFAFTVTAQNVKEYCNGFVDGSLTLNITPSGSSYFYSINGGTPIAVPTPPIIPQKEGTYYIRVYDEATDCYYEVNDITITKEKGTDPISIGTILTTINPTCNQPDGEIQFFVTGGSGAYEYSLYKNGVLVLPANITYPANGKISGLGAGNYYISVRDMNYTCDMATSQGFVLDNDNALLAFNVTSAGDVTDCGNTNCTGVLDILITEGTAVSFNMYNLTNGSTSSGSPVPAQLTGLCAGVYVIEIEDIDGCKISSGEVRINAEKTASGLDLDILEEIETSACAMNDGAVRFTVTGTLPYYYQLNSGAVVTATTTPQTVTLSSLPAGTHILRVFNACGELSKPAIIGTKNSTLAFSAVKRDVTVDCDNIVTSGYIALNVTGGSNNYKYIYTDAANVKVFATTSGIDTIKNLKEGIYTVEIIDAVSGCTCEINGIELKRKVSCAVELGLKLFLQGVTQAPGINSIGDVYKDDYGVVDLTVNWMTNYIQVPLYPTVTTSLGLPENSPYDVPGTYADINNIAGIAGKVVDWILVEIWANCSQNGLYIEYDLLDAKALLLKTDGSVVDVNGQKAKFISSPTSNVHIVIKHRNHLSVMSPEIPFIADFDYDFTDNISKALQSSYSYFTPMVMRHGIYTLWAGDLDSDHLIDNADASRFYYEGNIPYWGGYHKADVNMDGFVENQDGSFILYNFRLGLVSPLFFSNKR